MNLQTFSNGTNTNQAATPVSPAATTTGKTVNAGIYSGIAVIVLAVAQAIISNAQFFSWKSGIIVVIASMLVAFIPNYLNKNVPNK